MSQTSSAFVLHFDHILLSGSFWCLLQCYMSLLYESPLFSNSGIFTYLLNLVAFLDIEFWLQIFRVQAPGLDIDLSCASDSDQALLLMF